MLILLLVLYSVIILLVTLYGPKEDYRYYISGNWSEEQNIDSFNLLQAFIWNFLAVPFGHVSVLWK